MPEPLPTFDNAVISGVTRHMNEDHADDTLLIARALGARPDATDARMIGLDNDGGDYEVVTPSGTETIRIPWARRLSERIEIRQEIVRMYDESCEILGLEPRAHE